MAKSGMPWPEIAGRQPAVSQMLDVGARHIVDFPLVVLAVSLLVQWLSAWLADAFRSRMRPLKELEREDYGIVLTASLTLLGLIIAFSFSMAVSRYDQRKNYEEAEANAIGTEYVRADLLPAAEAARVRELLRTVSRSARACSTRPAMGPNSGGSTPIRRNCRTSSGRPSGRPPRRSRRLSWPSPYRA